MNKKEVITAWVFCILIIVISYGKAYSDNKINNPAQPYYKGNIIDKIIYKKVVLPGGDIRPVLVNRITGEVKYIWLNNNQWVLLTGAWKQQCQEKYDNAQAISKTTH